MTPDEVVRECDEHVARVREHIQQFWDILHERSISHDNSKYNYRTELPGWVEGGSVLKNCTYGSEEYKEGLQKLQPTIQMHYETNRHHPEHFSNGIAGMNLVDLVEMFCDWLAATHRHEDGDILKSIAINKERFGYDDILESIFVNTAKLLVGEQEPAEAIVNNQS